MYTVISGTNRPQSYTSKIALHYFKCLQKKDVPVNFFSLEDLPVDFIYPEMYDVRAESLQKLHQELLFPTLKYIFVFPEYNGSIPGILKLLIDSCDIPKAFHYKKAAMAGISTGRAGNLRGMDHLTSVLHHMRMTVLHSQIPISIVNTLVDADGFIHNTDTVKVIDKQIEEFIKF